MPVMFSTESKSWSRSTRTLALAIVVSVGIAGCSSSEDRQAKYFQRAQELMGDGEYAKAKLEVRNVLQINENHVPARYLWALLLEREQNFRQMFANLQLAVDLDPGYIDARIKLGQTYYRAQQYDDAMEQAEAVLGMEPENADGLTLYGSVLYRRGDNEGAVEAANRALLAEPGHVGATSIITEIYKQSDPQQALAVIGDGIERQSRDATLKLLEISVYKAQADDESVILGYRDLMQEYPENLFYHYQLVKFLEERERIDEAENVLRDIVKTKPDNTQLKLWLAEFLANQRNLQLAESTVKEFIQREPGLFELRFALGKIYEALGSSNEASRVYDEIIALDVDGADSLAARNQKVQVLLKEWRLEEVESVLRDVLAIEPENPRALLTLAKPQLARGELDTAIAGLRIVVKNDPQDTEAWLMLGEANTLRGASDLAVDNFKTALGQEPANFRVLARVLPRLAASGEREFVDLSLLEAQRIAPDDPRLRAFEFEMQLSLGELERAEAAISWFESAGHSRQAVFMRGLLASSRGDFQQGAELLARAAAERPAPRRLRALETAEVRLETDADVGSYFAPVLQQHPDNPDVLAYAGSSLLRAGKMIEGKSLLQRSAQAGTSSAGYVRFAQMLLEDGKVSEAVDVTRNLEDQLGDSQDYLITAGQVYESAQMIETAMQAYERALYLNPGSVVAANNLAMLLLGSGEAAKVSTALALTERFSSSDVPALLDTYGRALLASNQPEDALEVLEAAVAAGGEELVDRSLIALAQSRMTSVNEP